VSTTSRPSPRGLLAPRQFTAHHKGHAAQADFSHRRTLVGKRPETRFGAKSKNPGGLKRPGTEVHKPTTYVLHSPKQVVRRTHHDIAKTG